MNSSVPFVSAGSPGCAFLDRDALVAPRRTLSHGDRLLFRSLDPEHAGRSAAHGSRSDRWRKWACCRDRPSHSSMCLPRFPLGVSPTGTAAGGCSWPVRRSGALPPCCAGRPPRRAYSSPAACCSGWERRRSFLPHSPCSEMPFLRSVAGLALGVFLLGSVIGGPLGITIGGVLLSLAQSGSFAAWPVIGTIAPWRAVLVTTGTVGLFAPLLILTITEPRRGRIEATDFVATRQHFFADRRRLLPLYGGLALLSIGDYGLVSWVPTALERVFGWTPDRVGIAFGIITAGAGIAGALLGGWIADLAARRGGDRARLLVSMVGAVLAINGRRGDFAGTCPLGTLRPRTLDLHRYGGRGERGRGDPGHSPRATSGDGLRAAHVHEHARGPRRWTAAHRRDDGIRLSHTGGGRSGDQPRGHDRRPRGLRAVPRRAPCLGALAGGALAIHAAAGASSLR